MTRHLQEIYRRIPRASCLFLTDDFPYDGNKLVEIRQPDFYGMRLRSIPQQHVIDPRHLMCLISIRRLAPLVHAMISTAPTLLDFNFLDQLRKRIAASDYTLAEREVIAFAVEGEMIKKPLEHLVTCVPGVEVGCFIAFYPFRRNATVSMAPDLATTCLSVLWGEHFGTSTKYK